MKIDAHLRSKEILEELGKRIKSYRVDFNMTQNELSLKTGICLRNIIRIEKGEDTNFINIIKILIALNIIDNINVLIPDDEERIDYKLRKKRKKRVVKNKNIKKKVIWGDQIDD